MGRELRRVIPNWQHPKRMQMRLNGLVEEYHPMYDRSCDEAWQRWFKDFQEWQASEHDRVIAEYGAEEYPKDQPYTSFCKWHGQPPDPEYYRPAWKDDERTWWQVYETVSEGTPVSPPFASKEELVEYLMANGDFWDQERRAEKCTTLDCSPWSREAAEKFVYGSGWAPSFIQTTDGEFMSGVEGMAKLP